MLDIYGTVWTEEVTAAPEGFDPMNIDSPEDLAWFISVVNGRSHYDDPDDVRAPAPATNARLTADLDMSAHNWVPIGSGGVHYTGTFDGNGHVITGLKNNALYGYKKDNMAMIYPGMFGRIGSGGVVKDVFVLDNKMRFTYREGLGTHYGIIADTLDAGGQIYNCEAGGMFQSRRNVQGEALTRNLNIGGLVGLNNGTIHSSMAVPYLRTLKAGGIVGQNNGTLRNSFANPRFYCYSTSNDCFSGLVNDNGATGIIDNCYVRTMSTVNSDSIRSCQLVGRNSGTVSHCFAPEGDTRPLALDDAAAPVTATLYPAVTDPTLYDYDAEAQNAMLNALNANRGADGSLWKCPNAIIIESNKVKGLINGNYPVLKYDYTCLGSADGAVIDYSNSLSDMFKRHNTGNLNENTTLVGDQYKVTGSTALRGGNINLYKDCDNRTGEVQNCTSPVWVDDNVALLQGDASKIKGRFYQTLPKPNEYWHLFSSSLSGVSIGISYGTSAQMPFSWLPNPCNARFFGQAGGALLPKDAPVESVDFYSFYEPKYHWVNFKRNSNSHWHQDVPKGKDVNNPANHPKINYTNETILTPGKGYLVAIDKEMQLQAVGSDFNNGDITIPVTYTAANAWTGYDGLNLIGNPYQSYLDFDEFCNVNGANLWSEGDRFPNTYSVYDATTDSYVQYQAGSSAGSMAASRYIHMHQGFFIVKDRVGTDVKFTNAMRTLNRGNGFRDSQPAYPLLNLIVTDADEKSDVAVLELDRSDVGGARKMHVASGTARIYLRHEDEDYAVLFRDRIEKSQPLYFETTEDGVFTLRWNTANADFTRLTLVDNITGVSLDMLSNEQYMFTAGADDYKSRFKIYVDSESEVPQEAGHDSFAFMHNGNLVVNGEGRLDIVDVLGRVLYSTELHGAQNTVSVPAACSGISLLRLSQAGSNKTQKIIINNQ